MPWCEECAKYWTPNSMNDDGTCPGCGRVVDEPRVPSGRRRDGGQGAGSAGSAGDDERAPWHFKLMVVALVAYLGWRFVEIFN